MNLIKRYSSELIIVFTITLLWFLRWDALALPYFWDEMGVYGNGLQNMLRDGIGLHPAKLEPEISRGHPLLLHVVHTLALKFFGNHLFVSHTLALIISSLTLVAAYFLAKKVLPAGYAALAVLLLMAQPVFLAQSALVLPEMPVALLFILTLIFFFNRQYLFSAIVCVVGVMVKESFIIIPAMLGAGVLLKGFFQRKSIDYRALYFTLPLLAFLIFLKIQHNTYGWYFFPYHTEIVQNSALSEFFHKFKRHVQFIFFKQGRNQWIIFAAIALVGAVLRTKGKVVLSIFIFFLLSVFVFSFAFYMDRYLLYLYPILAILVIYGLYILPLRGVFRVLIFVYLFSAAIYESNDKSFRYDVNLSYQDVVLAQQKATSFVCNELSEGVLYADFPMNMGLKDTLLSYVDTECLQKVNFKWQPEEADYMMLFNVKSTPDGYILKETFIEHELGFYLYEKL